MKQIEVRVRSDWAETVLDLADRHDALAPARHRVEMEEEGSWDRILVNVPNRQVGPLVSAIEEAVSEAVFVIPAGENIPVRTPVGEVRDQVADVSSRSTLELVLDVHQSVGTSVRRLPACPAIACSPAPGASRPATATGTPGKGWC